MPTNRIDQLFEEWYKENPDQKWDVPKSFARYVLEKHLTDEIKWLEGLKNLDIEDWITEVKNRKDQLKTELKP